MPATPKPRPDVLTRLRYEEAAETYLRALPLEHFMEATTQGTQREITLESFALVRAARTDFHVFNELLVQYPLVGKGKKLGQVVPDNMVVIHPGPIKAGGSYDVPFQPVGPFLVLEYVSKSNKRKDYDDNMRRYEKELKVPYYLLFYPDGMELTVFALKRGRYSAVTSNPQGRFPIVELELEAALLDDWVRYWFRGELLPLPADLAKDLAATRKQLQVAERRATEAERQAADLQAELARLRAELGRRG